MTELAAKTDFFAEVAVAVPVGSTFTYSIPESLANDVCPGKRVIVPFKNSEQTAYVTETHQRPVTYKIKPIKSVLDEAPIFTDAFLSLTQRISEYYCCSWGEAIENALPKWIKHGKKAANYLKRKSKQSEKQENQTAKPAFTLSKEQNEAFETIQLSMAQSHPRPILLQGVTGSGKSELYIRAIKKVLEQNKSAIVLVPEITLTEQLKIFFTGHFGNNLEILHSKLSEGERFKAWHRIKEGAANIVLGPRSAIFAPVNNLGLIVMDEEHDSSYKQETTPRYHTRQVAQWRCEIEAAQLILGSATPSMESMFACEQGKYIKKILSQRIDSKPMPQVMIVDLKEQMAMQKKHVVLSHIMSREIEKNLKAGEGTILLLNRRGYNSQVFCPDCAQAETCPSCEVSLTFHQEKNILVCHYCNYQKKPDEKCSHCGNKNLKFLGTGTEKLESEVARWFPKAKIDRLDTDTIKSKGSHEEILGRFRNKETDILIGTQMIAKGFDFSHVTLVGVIQADVGLILPDFRSSEKTFQLLTQVAGRAGRGSKPGRVVIQTFSPKHDAIVLARTHDTDKFYEVTKPEREKHFYPPFHQLINIIVRAPDEKKAYQFARELRDKLREEFGARVIDKEGFEIIGPSPLPFYKLRGHYRWHVMIKQSENTETLKIIKEKVTQLKKPAKVQVAIDVDPANIL